MSISAEALNNMNETVGLSPQAIWMKFEFPEVRERIINAARRGLKEVTIYAPFGIDFSLHFPGCVITHISTPMCSAMPPKTMMNYEISWGKPANHVSATDGFSTFFDKLSKA